MFMKVENLSEYVEQGSSEERKTSMSNKKNQHVVPHKDGWAVRGAGNSKATSTHATQERAIEAAKAIAKNQSSEMLIHNRQGRIRERNTYGKDPHPPKG